MVERPRDCADMTDIKIGKETVSGEKCTLEGTAKSSKGFPLRARYSWSRRTAAGRSTNRGGPPSTAWF